MTDPLAAFAAEVRSHFPGAQLTRLVVKLNTPHDRDQAKRAIDRAPQGYAVDIHEDSRTAIQNRALWPRLYEIQRQRPSLRGYPMTPELWKCVFLHDLGIEVQMAPTLNERGGVFPLDLSSSALGEREFADLLTSIDAYCAEQGIVLKQREAA